MPCSGSPGLDVTMTVPVPPHSLHSPTPPALAMAVIADGIGHHSSCPHRLERSHHVQPSSSTALLTTAWHASRSSGAARCKGQWLTLNTTGGHAAGSVSSRCATFTLQVQIGVCVISQPSRHPSFSNSATPIRSGGLPNQATGQACVLCHSAAYL